MKRNIPRNKRYKPPKPKPAEVYKWSNTITGRMHLEVAT